MDVERIKRVKDRLFLYDKISDLKEFFRGDEYTEHPSEGTFDHKFRHYQALRFYLLLTCFDILGQESEFIDFNEFLNSNKFKTERIKLLREFSTETEISKIKIMYEYYLKIYGFKKRYLYFIDNILDETQRNRLYSTIKIQKVYNAFKAGVRAEDIVTVKKKNDFLLSFAMNLLMRANRGLQELMGYLRTFQQFGKMVKSSGHSKHSI